MQKQCEQGSDRLPYMRRRAGLAAGREVAADRAQVLERVGRVEERGDVDRRVAVVHFPLEHVDRRRRRPHRVLEERRGAELGGPRGRLGPGRDFARVDDVEVHLGDAFLARLVLGQRLLVLDPLLGQLVLLLLHARVHSTVLLYLAALEVFLLLLPRRDLGGERPLRDLELVAELPRLSLELVELVPRLVRGCARDRGGRQGRALVVLGRPEVVAGAPAEVGAVPALAAEVVVVVGPAVVRLVVVVVARLAVAGPRRRPRRERRPRRARRRAGRAGPVGVAALELDPGPGLAAVDRRQELRVVGLRRVVGRRRARVVALADREARLVAARDRAVSDESRRRRPEL